ncbi:hypothetical protein HPB51_024380 [Rhipicephalus microplus]|uniref:Uncharacterized protein n=1 Tax=Rhipicephalus microplus TaxID=6941 RepID=A0A9J6D765_RHIMP|nr:hypothetical protein HPB51_024380 [Rhipicephalus microplus]
MPELLPEIHLVANQASRRRTEKQEKSQERKLSALLEKGRKTRGPMFEVRNLSSYELTPAECKVLSRGLNFNQAKQPDTRKVVCAVENAIGLLGESERDEVRTRAVGILSRIRKSGCQQVLSEDEEKAIKALHKNKKIAVLPADKGNVTVVLDRSTYESKMTEIVGDCTTQQSVQTESFPGVHRAERLFNTTIIFMMAWRLKHLWGAPVRCATTTHMVLMQSYGAMPLHRIQHTSSQLQM